MEEKSEFNNENNFEHNNSFEEYKVENVDNSKEEEDNKKIILQHYLSGLRGQDVPVFVIRDDGNTAGLFNIYNDLFIRAWEEAKSQND